MVTKYCCANVCVQTALYYDTAPKIKNNSYLVLQKFSRHLLVSASRYEAHDHFNIIYLVARMSTDSLMDKIYGIYYVRTFRYDLSYTSTAVLTFITRSRGEAASFFQSGLYRHRILFRCTTGTIFFVASSYNYPRAFICYIYGIRGTVYFAPGSFIYFANSPGKGSA